MGLFSKASKTKFYPRLKAYLARTSVYFLAALGLWATAWYFKVPEPYLDWVRKLALLVVVFQVGRWGNELIRTFLLDLSGKTEVHPQASRHLINFFSKFFLYAFLLLLALDILGFNVTTVIAGLGVGGVAVALASQSILSDLFSSLTIVLDKPFEIGDSITVGDVSGTVQSIGIKTTRLRALSGEQLIFSNSDLLKARIHNFKRMSDRRILFRLRLAYGMSIEQIKQAKSIVIEEIRKLQNVTLDRVHFFQIGDFSFDLEAVYYFHSPIYNLYMDAHEKLLLNIRDRFEKEKIDFALPPLLNVNSKRPNS